MFGGLEPIPTDPQIDPPLGACFNCWRSVHRCRECPFVADHVYCFNCGRRGEDLSSCPRCAERNRQRVAQGLVGGVPQATEVSPAETPAPEAAAVAATPRVDREAVREFLRVMEELRGVDPARREAILAVLYPDSRPI